MFDVDVDKDGDGRVKWWDPDGYFLGVEEETAHGIIAYCLPRIIILGIVGSLLGIFISISVDTFSFLMRHF